MGVIKTMQAIKAAVAVTIVAAYEVYARQVPDGEAMTREDFAKEVERGVREQAEKRRKPR